MKRLLIVIIAAIMFVLLACDTGDGCVSGGVSDEQKIESGSRYCSP